MWFAPKGTGTGTQGAEAYAKGEELAFFQKDYAEREPGVYLEGPVHIAFIYVEIEDAQAPARANVLACIDRRDVRRYNSTGQDVTDPEQQGRYEKRYVLDNSDGTWKLIESYFESANRCVA